MEHKVDLIDEQQRLIVDVNFESSSTAININNSNGGVTNPTSSAATEQMSIAQLVVAERKQQRQALLVKRDRINNERENQMLEKKEILSMLEQLLTLETRLVLSYWPRFFLLSHFKWQGFNVFDLVSQLMCQLLIGCY